MKFSCLMRLFLVGYILCFGKMMNLNNRFVDAKTLENFDDFQIEDQLKVINKPATKIIKTIYGDIYGCVDFYKQPAFEHLSTKNHSFHYEMRPASSILRSKPNHKKFGYLWENGVGCPIGTVPIKRITKDELLKLNSFSTKYRPQNSWNFSYNQDDSDQHHFAVSRTKGGQGKYNGASMIVSINDPQVKFPQYSSARMHIQIGDDFIQTGWTVNLKLYPDNKTRTFVFTKAGESQCYNSMCPAGIIMVRSDHPLGSAQGPPCVRNASDMHLDIFGIFKDKANGNWWLELGGEQIGFWPADRFKQSFANKVEWGGEVYSAFMPSPQMGNGHFPVKHPYYDAIIYNITTVNQNFVTDYWVKNTEAFSDNTRGYKVIDDLHSQFKVKHMIHFGGPGNI